MNPFMKIRRGLHGHSRRIWANSYQNGRTHVHATHCSRWDHPMTSLVQLFKKKVLADRLQTCKANTCETICMVKTSHTSTFWQGAPHWLSHGSIMISVAHEHVWQRPGFDVWNGMKLLEYVSHSELPTLKFLIVGENQKPADAIWHHYCSNLIR